MNYELAERLLVDIERTKLTPLKDALFTAAINYAEKRSRWYVADAQARMELDEARRRAHNVFVEACNILSRNQSKAGEAMRWRRELPENRTAIGDFACYLQCILSLKGR